MFSTRLLIAWSLFISGSNASTSICSDLLAGGVFDSRNVTIATANRHRFQYVFCSEQAATRDQAKSLSASLNIVDMVGAFFGQTESDYQTWRSSLCSDLRTDTESSQYLSDRSKVASKAILDAFNQCVHQNGLTQHAESALSDPARFLWIFHYTPSNESVNAVHLRPVWTSPVHCMLNNKPAPSVLLVGVGGKALSCNRDPCQSAVLTANADEESVPKTIALNPISKQYAPPFQLVKTQTFNMTAPISVGDLPIDSECKETHEGSWHPHRPNPAWVLACPGLTFSDGSAGSDFDHGTYDDNDGSCTYRFYCRPRVTQTPSPCDVHPLRLERVAPKRLRARLRIDDALPLR